MARELFSETQDDLCALDEEIVRAQQILDLLQEKRTSKVERMDRFRVAFAPHKDIPAELWAKIFVYCMGDTETIIPPGQHSMPYVLGMVCSRWRLISHAEHSLWNKIYLSPSASFEAFQHILPFIGTLLIEIRVEATYTLLEIFSSSSHRIRALKVAWYPGIKKDLALAKNTYPFTALESLDFTAKYATEALNPWISLALSAFCASGNLRRLKLASYPANHPSAEFLSLGINLIFLPLNHLNEFTISGDFSIPCIDLLITLQRCRSLTRCDVTIATHSSLPVLPCTVMLQSLCILKILITGQSTIDFGQFLSHLACPRLKLLALNLKHPIISLPEDELLQFISNSPSLEDLAITPSCPMSVRFFERLVWSAPALDRFSFVTDFSIPEKIIDSIRENNLIPNIRCFSVWVTLSRALSELLAERWKISDVNVTVLRNDFEAEEESFSALEISLKDAGRNITFIELWRPVVIQFQVFLYFT